MMLNESKNPELVRAACSYIQAGLRVIPLHDRSKKPRIGRWDERASNDPGEVARWFERWPEANIGLLTGHGLVAIDIDPDRDGLRSFAKLHRGRKLPFTAIAQTG